MSIVKYVVISFGSSQTVKLCRLTDLVATRTPDVCTVFCISKEKIQFARSATKGPPPCKTIYEEETIICDLFKEEEEEEEEEEETIIGDFIFFYCLFLVISYIIFSLMKSIFVLLFFFLSSL